MTQPNLKPPARFSIQELVDASPAIISLIDVETWEVVYQNGSGREVLGAITGELCYRHIPKQPNPCGFCRAKEALATGKSTSAELETPEGKWLLVQWAPVRSDEQVLVVETITDITETKRREEEFRTLKDRFERLSQVDPMTGLLNRRGFLEHAQRICQRAVRDQELLELFIVDVDHFKVINDQHGHAVGDEVLTALASLLKLQFRPSDVIARWGGEEFIVLVHPPVRDLYSAAERVRTKIAEVPLALPRGSAEAGEGTSLDLVVTVSMGGAACAPSRGDQPELEELIRLADRRLYEAKTAGRNQVVVR